MNAPDDAPTIWLMMHGSGGEYESTAVELGIALLGFQEIPDLTSLLEEEIGVTIEELHLNLSQQQITSVISQQRMFACRMRIGDGIAASLHNQPGQIAIGTITGTYKYREIDGEMRHTRSVNWLIPSMPKKELGEHLRHYFWPKRTVNPIRNNEAVERIRALIEAGGVPAAAIEPQHPGPEDDEAPAGVSIQQLAHEEIAERIHSRFPADELERLVAAILAAEGYVSLQSHAGADQGVDVLAGHGPMGFDPPRICVQVKHTQGTVSAPTVQQLRGAMTQFGADQGLFVSWSGYTADAEKEARRNFFTMRLWNANDMIEAVCRNYDNLPEEIRAEIPLKQVWTLVRDDDQ